MDLPFLQDLYATTRAAEMSAAGWPPTLATAFVKNQFELQHRHYVEGGVATDFWVIERHHESIGRLYLDRSGTIWRVVDVALLPQWQGQGVGAALLMAIKAEARARGCNGVDLHVLTTNVRAAQLYRRLGFVRAANDSATHHLMVWSVS